MFYFIFLRRRYEALRNVSPEHQGGFKLSTYPTQQTNFHVIKFKLSCEAWKKNQNKGNDLKVQG